MTDSHIYAYASVKMYNVALSSGRFVECIETVKILGRHVKIELAQSQFCLQSFLLN